MYQCPRSSPFQLVATVTFLGIVIVSQAHDFVKPHGSELGPRMRVWLHIAPAHNTDLANLSTDRRNIAETLHY
jgi:hypothetical protein